MSPSTKPTSTTNIENLPLEMINELFKYLPLKDLAVCSMVNKCWNSIYSNFKVCKLFVDDDRYLEPLKWFDLNRTVREAEQLNDLEKFGRLVEKPLLSNLKYLALCDLLKFDLNKLNRFQQLVHLEVNSLYNLKTLHLNLPKLKVLAFHNFNWDCSLLIDCPLLSTLCYIGEDANLLEVKHPETIHKLETGMIGAKLIPFKNVECLITWKLEAIDKATLLSLPKLRELQFNNYIKCVFVEGPAYGTVDRVKRMLNEFMNEAKKLRDSDFRFSFSGFQLTNMDQIDFGMQVDEETGIGFVTDEHLYMKNYHLVEPGALQFIRSVDYTLLLSGVTGEFPRCFPQKFTGIHWVEATGQVQDSDHFLWFLKSLRLLRSLVLERTGLGQEFYDQLPASIHLLARLQLRDGHCENELNFDFIDQLSLSDLVILPSLSFESLPTLVRWLGRLERGYFSVRLKDDVFDILKHELKEWRIESYNEELFKSKNPDEIAGFFKALQDKQARSPESN